MAATKHLKEKKIAEIINPRLIQAAPDISVKQAVDLMRENKSAYIVVADKGQVAGILTETDVVRKILGQNVDWTRPIRDFMTTKPMVLTAAEPVGKAVDIMAEHDIYHIPLVDEKQHLSGVLSVRTLIRFLAEFYPSEVYNLPPNPHQVMPSAEGG